MDIRQIMLDAQPKTIGFRVPDPLRDSSAIDLDGVELAERQEPFNLLALEGAHASVLDTTVTE